MDVPIDPARKPQNPISRIGGIRTLFTLPWWLVFLVALGIYISIQVINNQLYTNIFTQLRNGIAVTLTVSAVAYISAVVIGLIIGLIRSSQPHQRSGALGAVVSFIHLIAFNLATLYVQVLRGLPILVTLLIVAFVIVPELNRFFENSLNIDLGLRGSSANSAIIALAFTYGAFLSETFRAGIQSVDRGQVEAARSLGMNYPQAMRYIVLPQAIRRVLPPLGNDMIAMIKDSSLVAILGIQDITQLAKLSSSASFKYMETYLIAASIYLTMTTIGSIVVRTMERRLTVQR